MKTIPLEESLAQDVKQFGDLLLVIGRQSSLRDPVLGEAALETDHSPSQIHAIMWVGSDGPLTMGELARRSAVTEKTITGIVDRLERADLLRRVRDQEDRRVIRVVLTEKGTEEFKRLEELMRKRFEGFLSLLDREDRDALFRILEKFRDRISQLPPVPTKPAP